jgi:hypothetical membrane protein
MGLISELLATINKYMKKAFIYILIFLLFTVNLIALSISMQCNQSKYLSYRIVSGIFAFLFGLIYIMFNYLQYRVKIKEDPCTLCGILPFPL